MKDDIMVSVMVFASYKGARIVVWSEYTTVPVVGGGLPASARPDSPLTIDQAVELALTPDLVA
jgi:hypothetical protein